MQSKSICLALECMTSAFDNAHWNGRVAIRKWSVPLISIIWQKVSKFIDLFPLEVVQYDNLFKWPLFEIKFYICSALALYYFCGLTTATYTQWTRKLSPSLLNAVKVKVSFCWSNSDIMANTNANIL